MKLSFAVLFRNELRRLVTPGNITAVILFAILTGVFTLLMLQSRSVLLR